MESLCGQPSLELGVKVVRVAGLDAADTQLEGGGTLFVRYYVPAGDGRRRLRVDTREAPCAGDHLAWGELARFERWGSDRAAAAAPGGGKIEFELRWRPRPSSSGLAALLGAGARRRASRVLARAELAWPEHAVAAESERWLTLAPAGRELSGCKAPRLLVEVNTVVAGGEVKGAMRKPGGANDCCGAGERCGQCGWVGSEEDMFLAATFSQ
ncbi:hypothetical protein BAE44_0006729 [Dichanthelium oligosanthes]|uniref:C2 domain-containing protein n=1 Tax=Dichanthelium oligosanthes TaxID=888268 RepID=A0A1E5W4M0_9POAL|nr:hypothetical protein BAE44_0006729 [Dichanthelium oligosanthes]